MYFSAQSIMTMAGLVLPFVQPTHAHTNNNNKNNNPHQLSATTIFQFSGNDTWIEGIRTRPDGHLVFTDLFHPDVWSIDPQSPSPQEADLIARIPSLTGLLGIEQLSNPDEYLVVGGRFTDGNMGFIEGSGEAWIIDFGHPSSPPKFVANLPQAGEPNGVALIPGGSDEAVLVADSSKGLIWRVDISRGGKVDKVLDVPELKVTITNSTDVWAFGVNDIMFGDDEFGDGEYLYWTNTNTRKIWRARSEEDGSFTTSSSSSRYANTTDIKPELVADLSYVGAIDGFTRGSNGTFFVTSNMDNKLVSVTGYDDGRWGQYAHTQVVLGGDLDKTIAGDTSAAFGKAEGSRDVLYVATSGAHGNPLPGGYIEGGKIVAVQVPEC